MASATARGRCRLFHRAALLHRSSGGLRAPESRFIGEYPPAHSPLQAARAYTAGCRHRVPRTNALSRWSTRAQNLRHRLGGELHLLFPRAAAHTVARLTVPPVHLSLSTEACWAVVSSSDAVPGCFSAPQRHLLWQTPVAEQLRCGAPLAECANGKLLQLPPSSTTVRARNHSGLFETLPKTPTSSDSRERGGAHPDGMSQSGPRSIQLDLGKGPAAAFLQHEAQGPRTSRGSRSLGTSVTSRHSSTQTPTSSHNRPGDTLVRLGTPCQTDMDDVLGHLGSTAREPHKHQSRQRCPWTSSETGGARLEPLADISREALVWLNPKKEMAREGGGR